MMGIPGQRGSAGNRGLSGDKGETGPPGVYHILMILIIF